MIFDGDMFLNLIQITLYGVASGFTIGFISWSLGFAIYSLIKWFKMA